MNTASNKEKAAKLHLEPFVPIIDKQMKYYKIIFTYLLLLTWSVIGSSTGLSEPDEKSLNTKASQLAIDKADSIGQNMLVDWRGPSSAKACHLIWKHPSV